MLGRCEHFSGYNAFQSHKSLAQSHMAAVKCSIRRQTQSGCPQSPGSQPRSYDHILHSFLSNEWQFSLLTFSLFLFQFKLVYSGNPYAQIWGRTLWKTPDFKYLRCREFTNRKGSTENSTWAGRCFSVAAACLPQEDPGKYSARHFPSFQSWALLGTHRHSQPSLHFWIPEGVAPLLYFPRSAFPLFHLEPVFLESNS